MKHQTQKSEKKIPFDIATRKIKSLRIDLTKEVKGLYSENYTTLKKEIKEDTNKWKHILCVWIRINIIQMSIVLKTNYRINAVPIKISNKYFSYMEQTFQKFIWNHTRAIIVSMILRQKNKVRGIIIPDIRIYYMATVIKSLVLA